MGCPKGILPPPLLGGEWNLTVPFPLQEVGGGGKLLSPGGKENDKVNLVFPRVQLDNGLLPTIGLFSRAKFLV